MTALALETRQRDSLDVMLLLALIEHPDLAEPIRVVRNGADITSNGEIFYAYPFDFVHEARGEDGGEGAEIEIDNLDPSFLELLRASTVAPTITLSVVMASDPDAVEQILEDLSITAIEYDAETIRGRIPKPQFITEPAPYQRFTPSNCPGLF